MSFIIPYPFINQIVVMTTAVVSNAKSAFICSDCCLNQLVHASYLPRALSSNRCAHSNSVASIAKPANTISHPGPGYGMATTPINRTTIPTIATLTFFTCFIALFMYSHYRLLLDKLHCLLIAVTNITVSRITLHLTKSWHTHSIDNDVVAKHI